jgi:shikimate kinase/3-dehydroquinate synthase
MEGIAALRGALVFAGFMGAGKTTLAGKAGAALGVPAIDADTLIEHELGSSISEYFDAHGEAEFRRREADVVGAALEQADGGVIALGGGALDSERVRDALERHTVVLVDVDIETAWERSVGSGRPLARDRDEFEGLYEAREAMYLACADAILPAQSALDGIAEALDAILSLHDAPQGTRLLWAHTESASYPVWIGRGLLGGGDGSTFHWPQLGRRFAVSDSNVADLYAGHVPDLAGLVEVEAGETSKTLQSAEVVWRAMADMGVTRGDHIVAVGGGVVGDLAGFCAATYQRGIPVIQVPTTVVAQVDSAFGGKTGIDLPEAKNFVGAYHQPAAVIVDTATLATLPPEEHAAGYAEVVKTALIAGGLLWDLVGSGAEVDDRVILACARTKLAVVAEDERDGGRRQVLNLGHTVAHAIETVTDYSRYRHGEAVALGLLAALRLSGRDSLRDQVKGLLEAAGLPTSLEPDIDVDAVVAATARDKKRIGESTPFVLIDAPGDVTPGHQVATAELESAIRELS